MEEKNYTHVVYVVKVWLRQNIKIYTGDKQYSYKICKKTFTYDTLKKHCKIHIGNKPFLCDIYNKTFAQTSALKYNLI